MVAYRKRTAPRAENSSLSMTGPPACAPPRLLREVRQIMTVTGPAQQEGLSAFNRLIEIRANLREHPRPRLLVGDERDPHARSLCRLDVN